MRHLPAWCLTCVAMAASALLHAQPRAPVAKAPEFNARPQAANACEGALCAAARWAAIALAWERGLDEHGVPLQADARANKSAEVQDWLRRLAGTFRIQGTYSNHGGSSTVVGTAKCSGIGDGPGLSCVLSATWKAPKEGYKFPALDSALYDAMQPLVVVFGIDPDTSLVRATLMDQRALRMRGLLMESAVALRGEPMSADPFIPYTWQSGLVAIKPDGDVGITLAVLGTDSRYQMEAVRLMYGRRELKPWLEFDLQLQRESPLAPP